MKNMLPPKSPVSALAYNTGMIPFFCSIFIFHLMTVHIIQFPCLVRVAQSPASSPSWGEPLDFSFQRLCGLYFCLCTLSVPTCGNFYLRDQALNRWPPGVRPRSRGDENKLFFLFCQPTLRHGSESH